jgi:hypothetical protein
MASTYTPLGIELQATGENAGTWGTKTNTNLQIIEQIAGGFTTQAVSDSGDTDLSVSDGSTGATLAHRIIEFTGTISASRNVTIPIDVQGLYVLKNSTSGSQNVVFKYVSGSGDSVTVTPGAVKLVYATANDGTNPDIDDCGFITASSTDTLTNKTLTSPIIGTSILDTNSNEVAKITATSSAVNEVTFVNAATGNNPSIDASGGDSNVGIALKTKGTGVIQAEDSGGNVSAVKIAGKETIWVPANSMYPNTTNGCAEIAQTELSNGPEIKTLDFDKDSDENAQFSVAFPKSWNEGTVTFQAFFTADSTNTGTVSWDLAGVAVSDDDTCNVAFGTAVAPTAKAHSGTANDLDVTAESGAITIAGSPAAGDQVFFQITRDVSDDSLTADAKLLGIKLFFTTDAANDL